MARDRRVVENNGVPEYVTYADLPDASEYNGISFVQSTGLLYRSDGIAWALIGDALTPLILRMPYRITTMDGWTKGYGTGATITDDLDLKLPDDNQSINLHCATGSGGAMFQKAVTIDLTDLPDDALFTFILHTDIRYLTSTQQQLRFHFYSNGLPSPTNGFVSPWCQFNITNGIQQFSFAKSDFTQEGTGDWSTVLIRIEVSIHATQIKDMNVLGMFVGLKTRPCAILSLDDSTRDHYYYAHQTASARGVPVTYYTYQEAQTGSNYPPAQMTRDQLIDIGKSGLGIICTHHVSNFNTLLTNLGEAGLRSEFIRMRDYIDQFSGTGSFFAWPEGNTGATQENYEALRDLVAEVFLSGRHVITSKSSFEQPPIYPSAYGYFYISSRIGLTNLADATTVKAAIDTAIARGESINIFAHQIAKTHSSEYASISTFTEVCDYLKEKRDAGLLDLETHASWYHRAQLHAKFNLDTTLPLV